MKYRSRLTQRIVIAFFLMTLTISGTFSLALTSVIHHVENHLVSTELKREIGHLLNAWKQGFRIRLDADTHLYISSENALPDFLQALEEGYTEVVLPNRAMYVYREDTAENRFYLVKDQTEFENQEKLLELTILGGFVASILLSLFLGFSLARTIIAPVRRLTQQVRQRDFTSRHNSQLSAFYPEDEVGELAEVLDETINGLREAQQRESCFTSDISHELRTPLMVIRSSCELLQEKRTYSESEITSVLAATSEIEQLTDTFLCLARDKKSSATESATLESILEASLGSWEKEANSKGLGFEYRKQDTRHPFYDQEFPAILIRTIVNNLLRNALYFTTEGSIHLTVEPGKMTICDTGSGIPDNEKSLIFSSFFQGERHNRQGVGLGLSIVQRICEQQGWQISVHDNQPHGSCFIVTLVQSTEDTAI